MKIIKRQKIGLRMAIIIFLISLFIIVVTTPIHEASHWIMSDIDPYIEPVEFHLFDDESFQNGQKILSSALGYVIVRETYPGSFKDRSIWMDIIQELICISIQILITCLIVSKSITLLKNKNQILKINIL
jgi:hypothetical protein